MVQICSFFTYFFQKNNSLNESHTYMAKFFIPSLNKEKMLLKLLITSDSTDQAATLNELS